MHNSDQLRLPTSNNAAAISERTLEECWSTLQRLFMHKSAMQQIQQVPRAVLGTPSGMGAESKPHQCQQCMKSFSSNHQLVQHIRVHTGEKPYKCAYCDRRFKQLSHVQQHTRLHTGERPYKCHLPDCGRAFIQLSNLQQHLRNHDAQLERAKSRPFHCNICGKGFATESSLRTHTSKELQLHLGVLQQHAALIAGPNATSCPVCHKLFLGGDALMAHMKHSHTDQSAQIESPCISRTDSLCLPPSNSDPCLAKRRIANHPCPVCGKHYVNEGSLRKHLASHPETTQASNNLRMWPCSVCQAVFTYENGLLTHMEHMRMDPKHQFAAQYVLSRAVAERQEHSSILAATLGVSAGDNDTCNSVPVQLVDDGRGSNSLCASPSANSECSSAGRLSSSAASEQGNSSHFVSQYGIEVNTDMHLTTNMSLMAAAVAASAKVTSPTNGINSSEALAINAASSSRCDGSKRSNVQAAVANLAAAMCINQANHQQSGGNISSCNISGSSNSSSAVKQQLINEQYHQHQHKREKEIPAHENIQSLSSPIGAGAFHGCTPSPRAGNVITNLQSGTTTVKDVITMNAIRDSMMRNNLSMGDPLGLQDQAMVNSLQGPHEIYDHQAESTLTSSHQIPHQVVTTLQNTTQQHHPHHNMSHSPETTIRMHQQAEAILRSHTEAAFRLAASVASNGVLTANGSLKVVTGANENENTILQNDSAIQDKVEAHQMQQQRIQHQHSTPQQQQEPNIIDSQQQSTIITSSQPKLTSDLSEAIRLQEQRLEQALRLHNDARALNFFTAAHQTGNTAADVVTLDSVTLQHDHHQQQQTFITQGNHNKS